MDLEISRESLRKLLSLGEVKFSYTKSDQSVRNANGTTHPDLIPEDKRPVLGIWIRRVGDQLVQILQ